VASCGGAQHQGDRLDSVASAAQPQVHRRHPGQLRDARHVRRHLGRPGVFALDGSQFVLGVRKDITLKVLTEAVIQDNTGAIIYNLAQQDMTALRLTFRVGWQVANLVNFDQPVEASRYPAAVLQIP
jgi:hypothetical protein